MSLLKTKLTTVLGPALAVALSLGTAAPAEAAPPEGMRWSDHAGLTSSRRPSQPTRVGTPVWTPRFYNSSPVVTLARR